MSIMAGALFRSPTTCWRESLGVIRDGRCGCLGFAFHEVLTLELVMFEGVWFPSSLVHTRDLDVDSNASGIVCRLVSGENDGGDFRVEMRLAQEAHAPSNAMRAQRPQ